MKTVRIVLFVLLLTGGLAGAASAAPQISAGLHVGPSGGISVDVGFFYDDLAPYGSWAQRSNYGWVWRPHPTSSSWRPYRQGHWVWTDYGWTWISDEPYGWATYHYGRWYLDPEYGWEWVPGNEWAPAWVSWQEGGDYVGWAPLPPSAQWSGEGFGGIDFSIAIAPEAYLFVPERQFRAPRLDSYYVRRGGERNIFRQTRNVTNYRTVDRRIFNQGLPVERVQQVIGRPVPRYQVGDLGADQRHHGARIQSNRVDLFRPQVERRNVPPPPERTAARRPSPPADARRNRQPNKEQPQRQERPAPPRRPSPPQAAPNNPPQGEGQGRPQGRPEGRPQRPPHGKPQDQPQDRPQGQPQGRPHGQPQGQPQGRPQGQPQGRPQGQPQGKPQGKPAGKPHGKPNEENKPPQGPGR